MEMTYGQSKESKIVHSQKEGHELHAKLSKILAIRKKTTKNQRHVQDQYKIQTAGSHLISHKDHIADPAAVPGTPSTTIQGMMESHIKVSEQTSYG